MSKKEEEPALTIEPEEGTILNANTAAAEMLGKELEALIGDDYSDYCQDWDKVYGDEKDSRDTAIHERGLLEDVVDTLEDIFYMVGSDGSMERWNSSVNEETGYSDSEIENMSAVDFFDEKDRGKISSSIGEAIERGYSKVEAKIVTKQGDRIPYEFRSRRLTGEDGIIKGIVGIGRNITEKRRREKQLTIINRMLRHNIRNNMNIVLTEARQLNDGTAPEDGNRIIQAGEKVIEQSKKARIINSLSVDNSRRVVMEITDLIMEVSDEVEEEFAGCEVRYTTPQSAEVIAVPQIKDAVRELIKNGVSHTQNISPTVSVEVDKNDESTRITVSDQGPPVPDRDIKALTGELNIDPLNHAEGLGMWMVYWVVERSCGDVFISIEDDGNEITVELDTPQATAPVPKEKETAETKC
jgi:PAS domain S-box-containing protein